MNRIAIDSQIHFGKPCVAGTRITVQCVLELIEAEISFSEIVRDYYPDLVVEDIHACLKYDARFQTGSEQNSINSLTSNPTPIP
jgi:uncharacterized protein (DUF433 family)